MEKKLKFQSFHEKINDQKKRVNFISQAEYDETKSALEISERAKILADSELRDSMERSNLLQTQNTTLVHAKRKTEQVLLQRNKTQEKTFISKALQNLQAEFEENRQDLLHSEDKAKTAIKDASL